MHDDLRWPCSMMRALPAAEDLRAAARRVVCPSGARAGAGRQDARGLRARPAPVPGLAGGRAGPRAGARRSRPARRQALSRLHGRQAAGQAREPLAGAQHVGLARLLSLAGDRGGRKEPRDPAGRTAEGAARHPEAADRREGRRRGRAGAQRRNSTGSRRAMRRCCCCSMARGLRISEALAVDAQRGADGGARGAARRRQGRQGAAGAGAARHAGGSRALHRAVPLSRWHRMVRCSSAPRAAA